MITKGKWTTRIAQPGTMLEVVGDDKEYVCSLLGSEAYKQANAQAISAVPDMIEALSITKTTLQAVITEDYQNIAAKNCLKGIQAALEKAGIK
jgi:hypothetical protein